MIFRHVIVKKKLTSQKDLLWIYNWLARLIWKCGEKYPVEESGEQYPGDGSWLLRIDDLADEGGTINNQDKSNNLRLIHE